MDRYVSIHCTLDKPYVSALNGTLTSKLGVYNMCIGAPHFSCTWSTLDFGLLIILLFVSSVCLLLRCICRIQSIQCYRRLVTTTYLLKCLSDDAGSSGLSHFFPPKHLISLAVTGVYVHFLTFMTDS